VLQAQIEGGLEQFRPKNFPAKTKAQQPLSPSDSAAFTPGFLLSQVGQ